MLRRILLVTPFLLVGCASPRSSSVIVGDPIGARVPRTEAPLVEAPAAHEDATEVIDVLAPESEVQGGSPPPVFSRQMTQLPTHLERFTLKGGYYSSSEDGLDDGYIVDVSWMRFMSPTFATEFEIGYLDANGSDKGVDRDVWSIPVMVNGRFNVPVGKAEIYGGLGLGSFYYDAVAKTPGVKVSSDGFLFGGDAFFGGGINFEAFTLGLEGKYYFTENVSDINGSLDAYVVMLTLGFGR